MPLKRLIYTVYLFYNALNVLRVGRLYRRSYLFIRMAVGRIDEQNRRRHEAVTEPLVGALV